MKLTRRTFLFWTGAATAGFAHAISQQTPRRPNVVLIYADDLGKGLLSHFGQRRFSTPNIDRVFREGADFTFAHGCMYCAPARASLLTGYHDAHLTPRWRINAASEPEPAADAKDISLPSGDPYLPEVFRRAGYVTAQIGKLGYGFGATRRQMERQGWDTYYGYLDHVACHGFYPPFLWSKPEGGSPTKEPLPGNTHPDSAKSEENETYAKRVRRWTMTGKRVYAPDRFIAKAEDFLSRRGKDGQPFFLFYPTTLPHGPVQIPASNRRYEGEGATKDTYWPAIDPEVAAKNRRLCYWDDATGKPLSPVPPYDADGLTDLEMEYASMVKRLDTEVGRLLDSLEANGLQEDTMVLFTSDNGHELYISQHYGNRCLKGKANDYTEHFHDIFNGNAGQRGLKWDNWQGGIGVPLAVRWPKGVRPGTKIPDLVSAYDLLPTFAELLDVSNVPAKDGRSLLPLFRGEHFAPNRAIVASGRGGTPALLTNDRRKLRGQALYDLSKDPREQRNLAAIDPEGLKRLRARLVELRQ